MEIDLNLPLQKGTWVKYGDNSVFIIALYEKLPVSATAVVGWVTANLNVPSLAAESRVFVSTTRFLPGDCDGG